MAIAIAIGTDQNGVPGRRKLTAKQAAALAGVSISLIYEMIKSGKLRAYRIGNGRGTIRIDPSDVEGVMRFNDLPHDDSDDDGPGGLRHLSLKPR